MNAPAKALRIDKEAPPPAPAIEITVARSLEQILQVMAVRAQAFVGDQDCPYAEEFDGNDFAGATHLLMRIDGEPAGTARIRWFGDFAKLERVAITSRHRGEAAAVPLIRAASELAKRKGYRKLLAYGQPRLLPYWQKMFEGLVEPRKGRDGFVFSDHQYIEVVANIEPAPDCLSLDDEPLRLNRPEGEWDRPGVLDRSTRRGASNPMRRAARAAAAVAATA